MKRLGAAILLGAAQAGSVGEPEAARNVQDRWDKVGDWHQVV